MAMFKNTQGITNIKFRQNIQCYCPLGKDYYTGQVSVEFVPDNLIPDYCEVEKAMRDMGGEVLVVEDLVANVYTYLMNNYKPKKLCVACECTDAVHFPVTVTKSN